MMMLGIAYQVFSYDIMGDTTKLDYPHNIFNLDIPLSGANGVTESPHDVLTKYYPYNIYS